MERGSWSATGHVNARYRTTNTPFRIVDYQRDIYREQVEADDRARVLAICNFISRRNASPTGLYNAITGTFGLDRSAVSADNECVHGRLPGDPCPQPAKVPGGLGKRGVPLGMVRNPSRLWTKSYPCGCWAEPVVTSDAGVPDLMSRITFGHHTHGSGKEPVGLPRVGVRGAENGKKSAVGGDRERRKAPGLVPA